jgi:predicted exporter
MRRGERARVAAGALGIALLLAFVLARMRVTSDITHFLPRGENDPRIELALAIATGEPARTMVLLIEARDGTEAAAASRAFERELLAEPDAAAAIERLQGGPPEGIEEAIWDLYRPRRLAFLADSPLEVRELLRDEALAAAVGRLKQRLASPMSSLLSRVAPGDPFLVLPGLFDRVAADSGSGLGVVDGRFVTTDGAAAALFLTTRAAASDSTVQRPLLAAVAAAFARVQLVHGGHLRLQLSGANRHAVGAEDSMRADMQRVSIASLAGIVVLYLLLFRSLQPFLLSLPVLGAGFLAGTTACLLAFGEIHGLTLAFGASLLGVAVDYSLHFFSHLALAPHPQGPRPTLSRIWASLVLCATTTIIGFAALLIATFPGLRELALFASAGLLASLGATWLLLPGLARPMRPTRLTHGIVRGLARMTSARGRARWWLMLPAAAILCTIAAGLPMARWDDGVSGLNRVDPALRAEDDAVHARVARFEQRRVVAAAGSDDQAALAVNERIAGALAAAVQTGEIGGFGSIAHLLPSAGRQRAVDAEVRADATLWPRLRAALTDAGFVAAAFEPFARNLEAEPPPALQPSDLQGTPLLQLVAPFRVTGPHGPVVLSFLQDVRDEPALHRRLAAIPGASLIDIEGALTGALTDYRQRMQELLLIGVLLVVAVVALRHRAARPTLVALVPPLIAAAGTVALLAIAGFAVNLMSLMALLMIVSMGDDYGIFLVDDDDPTGREATHLSVLLSSATTILGFGLLALSEQPALFAIGLTSAVGILFCVVLALSTGALFAPARQEGA